MIWGFFLVSKSARSGLNFPVGRVQRSLREGRYAKRIGTGAAVYLSGVLEYLSAEILEISGTAATANKKVRITPRHIKTTIQLDPELNELLKHVDIPYAGVTPFIHPVLLPTESKRKDKPPQMAPQHEEDEEDEVGVSQENGDASEEEEGNSSFEF